VWRERNEDTYADSASELTARIDAALAEPTGPERSPLYPGEGTWSVFAEKVVAERDEARAALADAYRRGAEAMRKLALVAVGTNAGCSHMICGYCPSPAGKIRTLPIPEDK
jgi:hypothetical protein